VDTKERILIYIVIDYSYCYYYY